MSNKQVTRNCYLCGAVPIPIGHRVHITRPFKYDEQAPRPDPTRAIVQDLDTGIWYGHTPYFLPDPEAEFVGYLPQLRELDWAETIIGKVIHCQVLQTATASPDLYTTLVIDPEG